MADSVPRLSLCILTLDAAAGTTLVNTVCGQGGSPDLDLDGVPVRLDLHTFDPAREQDLGAVLNMADAAALVVHHIDAPSLEMLKAAYRIMPSEHRLPLAVLIVREATRLEFKMACPTCSQKLWVRDEDQGRVGRCPHCKKTFVLPAQAVLIRQQLALPSSMPVVTVMLGHMGACRGPLSSLAERARLRSQVTKSSTVQVQITGEQKPPTSPGL